MNTLIRRPSFFDTELDFQSRFWNTDGLRLNDGLHPVNIRDAGKTYEVELAVPGYKKEDLQISLDQGVLYVGCEKTDEQEDREDGYTRREFRTSSFKRSFQLPDAADEESLKAKYDNGVLRISIGKRKGSETKIARTVKID